MMQRYASCEVLSVEVGPGFNRAQNRRIAKVLGTKQTTATFNKAAHRAEFDYDPKPGHLYVRSRAISSRCNDNFDEFPASEIKQAYRTFVGKPVFVNHHNENHRRARGVIIDAALHEDVNPDGSPDTWAEVLMEVDAMNFPKLAQAILAGHIDRTSMGTDVKYSLCSFCGNKAATPLEYCAHIPRLKGKKIQRTTASGEKTDILVREICYGLGFFENSLLVEEPADPTAFTLGVDTRGLTVGELNALGQPTPTFASLNRPNATQISAKPSLGLNKAASLIAQAAAGSGKRLHFVLLPQGDHHKAHQIIHDVWGEATGGLHAEAMEPNEALARLRNTGGFTFHVRTGEIPSSGYAVGNGQNEVVYPISSFTPDDIQAYEDSHADLLSASDHYFGGWVDTETGKVYLDVAQHFSDRDQAIATAQQREEKAIYDLGAGVEIRVDGTTASRIDRAAALIRLASQFSYTFVPGTTNRGIYEMHRADCNDLKQPKYRNVIHEAETTSADSYQQALSDYVNDIRDLGYGEGDVTVFPCAQSTSPEASGSAVPNRYGDDQCSGSGEPMQGNPRGNVPPWSPTCGNCGKEFLYSRGQSELGLPTPVHKLPPKMRNASVERAAALIAEAMGEAHDPARRSEYIGKCSTCGGKYCWPNQTATSGVRAHQTDTRFRCPKVTCDGTVKQTTRLTGNFNHLEDRQVSALQRFAYNETMAPAQVDTLRDEFCPVCKESDSFDGDRCQVCGFQQPPDEFTDPDTDIAKAVDLRQDQDDTTGDAIEGNLECTNCGHTFESETGAPPPEATPIDPDAPVDANGQPTVPPTDDPNDPASDPNKVVDPNDPKNPDQPVEPGAAKADPATDPAQQKTDPNNAAKPDPDPATDPAKVLNPNLVNQAPTPDVGAPGGVPPKAQKPADPAKPAQSPTQGTEDNPSTNPVAGDKCPDCGEGQLQQKNSAPQSDEAPQQDDSDDSDKADDKDKQDGQGSAPDPKSDDGTKSDDKDKDGKSQPPWLKNKKSSVAVIAQPEQKEESMRPALAALAEQQKIIEAHEARIASLQSVLAFVVDVAGLNDNPKVASLMKSADEDNPAQPVPAVGSEAPVESTDQARAPEATDDVTTIGATPVTDVAPAATTTPDSTTTELDQPLDLNEEDVEKAVAGTDTMRPESETRIDHDVQVGTGDNTTTMNPWTISSKQEISEGRTFASLRLARLQIQAGITEAKDDLVLAHSIAASKASDEAIQSEIATLAKVVTANKREAAPRNLVPQNSNKVARTVPSFSEGPVTKEASVVSGPGSDEFLFE